MDKKTIIYSFKTIFKKTKLICPYCGTVQNYKKNSCCVCHKSLDSVKDNTLKIKNCIRAGIGILVLSVISVVTAMVINNALKKKPVYFLVKPYSSDYVRDSIYKLMNIIQEEQADLITIKSAENKGRLVTIKTRDIYYIESELRVAHIYTIDNLYTTYMTLDEIQNKLKNNFLRCHRSFIVNSDKIKKFIKQGFILFNDKFVPISRSKSKEINNNVRNYIQMS